MPTRYSMGVVTCVSVVLVTILLGKRGVMMVLMDFCGTPKVNLNLAHSPYPLRKRNGTAGLRWRASRP